MRCMAVKLIFATAFMFYGCAQKVPNTWQKRVLQDPVKEEIKLHARVFENRDKQTIVLLHGFGTSWYSFSRIIPELSKYFTIYAIDLKGFGKSPKPKDNRYSVYDQAVLVDKFLREKNLKNIILIGHSYGGGVALSLVLMDKKRVKKMVLIDSACYDQKLPKLIRWLQIPIIGKIGFFILPSSFEVKESYKYAFYDDSKIPEDIVREYTKNLYLPNAKSVYFETTKELIPKDIDKISKKYSTIKIPTLLIWGENDIVIPKEKAYRLHKDLKNSKLVIIPKCGHMPHEERPKETLKALKSFLDF